LAQEQNPEERLTQLVVSALVDLAKLNSWNLSMMSLLTWKMENKQIFWSWIF
jgi:hypothetical protein